jgi:YggT family protein
MIDGPVGSILCIALWLASILLLVRVVVSWIALFGARPPATGPLRTAYDLLFDVTEPILRPIRAIVPPAGMFDLSVAVAFVIIFVLRTALC